MGPKKRWNQKLIHDLDRWHSPLTLHLKRPGCLWPYFFRRPATIAAGRNASIISLGPNQAPANSFKSFTKAGSTLTPGPMVEERQMLLI